MKGEGNGNVGKSNGDGNKEGKGKGKAGRRDGYGDKEGNGNGGRINGNAIATATGVVGNEEGDGEGC